MDKERFLASGLLEQYVLGLTSDEENEEVEKYANAFPEIRSEIDSLRDAMEQYATEYTSPISREQEPQTLPPKRTNPDMNAKTSSWPFLFALSAILLTAVLAGNFYLQKKDFESRYKATTAAYATFQAACEKKLARQTEIEQVYLFLNMPTTQIIQLHGSAAANAYWNKIEQKGYINLLNFPVPPEGKQYQIWAEDIEHQMLDIGLLAPENGKIQSIGYLENVASLNITLEPEGGSTTPNVEPFYVKGPIYSAK